MPVICPACLEERGQLRPKALLGLPLGPLKLAILRNLIEADGQSLSGDELAAAIYGGTKDAPAGPTESIRVSVHHLRRTIEPYGYTIPIVTGRGVRAQYRLAPVERGEA